MTTRRFIDGRATEGLRQVVGRGGLGFPLRKERIEIGLKGSTTFNDWDVGAIEKITARIFIRSTAVTIAATIVKITESGSSAWPITC